MGDQPSPIFDLASEGEDHPALFDAASVTADWKRNLAVADAIAAAVTRYAEAAEKLARATQRQAAAVERQVEAIDRNTAQLAKRPKARLPWSVELLSRFPPRETLQ